MHRSTWILAFGLALLFAPAQAVPCRDDSCAKEVQGDREASSIQLKSMQPGDRSYGAPPIPKQTALVLFAGGLLLTRAALRRRRS